MRTRNIVGARSAAWVSAIAATAACSAAGLEESADSTGSAATASGPTVTIETALQTSSCMDVSGAGTANGTQIQEWPCNGTGAQSFRIQQVTGGVRLVNANSGKCVDVSGSGTANGTKVQIWTCNGTGAQLFGMSDAGSGRVTFVNVHSGKCLDINGASLSAGTKVQLWDCNGGANQAWIVPQNGQPDAGTPPPPPDAGLGQCCPGYSLATSCASANLARSRWCIANDAPNGNTVATLPTAFCSFGEQVVSTLEQVFNIPAPKIFEFDVATNGMGGSTGGAQTPTVCGTFGNAVTYDAFTGNAYGARGFWGYLLSLHEAINQWTGLTSGGWPTDWWADHQSAFPNLMDFHIMNLIGTTNSDNNLLTAAAAQKMRFYPGGDTADSKVVALDDVYSMMPNMDGLSGFSHVFSMVKSDNMDWGKLGTNPNQKLSEYVLSYMALAVGQSGNQVLPTVQGPSANGGGNICNGTLDPNGDPTYTCSESDIDAIATAHCSIAAAGRPAAALSTFQSGNFDAVGANGPCGSTCPSECACKHSTNQCVAPWLGD